jgi:beta-lactamase class A
VLALLLAAAPACAQLDMHTQLRSKLQAQLAQIDADFPGVLGVELIDLTSGERIGRNAGAVFPTASTIKVAVLAELYHQAGHDTRLLVKQLPFKAAARTADDGLARLIGPGSQLAVGDLARLMINLSENTATNLLIDELGMEKVNSFMDTLGLRTIRLQRHMLDADAERADHENVASPADGAQLMARIARCELPLTRQSCAAMLQILEMPKTPFPATDPIPTGIVVAFKPGNLEGVLNGWGYVELPGRPYVFAIMTTYGTDNAAAVRATSAAAFDYFSRLARTNRYGARVAAP